MYAAALAGKPDKMDRGALPDSVGFTHLIVVGSSAGGIEALSTLVSTLPEKLLGHRPTPA